MEMEGKLKGNENLNVEYANGEQGKVLKRHEKLEVEKVIAMQGTLLKQYNSSFFELEF